MFSALIENFLIWISAPFIEAFVDLIAFSFAEAMPIYIQTVFGYLL